MKPTNIFSSYEKYHNEKIQKLNRKNCKSQAEKMQIIAKSQQQLLDQLAKQSEAGNSQGGGDPLLSQECNHEHYKS